jgi:tetratricopeptide (TPR) repeat protein
MLMRMGGTRARGGVLAALLGTLVGAAHAAAAPAPAGMRPYDEEKYTLAYEVFLGARNLEDAYRVAQAAVAQVPQHAGWRQRLAQVAEWTGRPAVALEQWRWLAAAAATATERERAWQAVLRLAPAAGDDEALLAAWLHAAETQPMNAERWRRIAEGFERVARPADGAQYFQRRYERSAEPLFLELRAYLLERLGRDEEAIAAYAALIEKHGAEGSRLLRAATLLLRHNRFREAFRLLDRHRRAVAQADAEFWNLFADLAWRLQQDAAAREAYETLARRPEAGELVWGRLVELTRDKDPAGAARVAALGYERTRSPALAVLATELYWQQRDLVELRRFHAAMSAQDEQRLAGNAYFFALRAQFHDADGRPREAVADYRRAIAIEPGNADLVSALLWHLVSRKETAALRRELARYEPRARESGGLAEVYAAAYAVLGELPRALAYYARLRDNKRDDYLWLLGYADVLEQAGNGAMALRVRRHAWQAMRAELKGRGERDLSRAELEAVARMTLADSPGDPALALVGRVLRQDFVRDPPDAPTRELDAGVRELVLSWALSTERMDAAKAWLWSQYARQLARPTWAQMSIALAENDREAVARLLAADDGALPVYDRIEAARVTARLRLAQTYAFDAQEKRRDDDELHVKLTETLLESANAIVYTDVPFERGVLKGREQRAVVRVWANERLRLALDFGGDGRLASTNPAALTGVPGRIEEYGLAARWRHERAHTDVRVGYRSALGTHYPLSFAHTREWAPRVSGVLGFTLDERAPETNPLYVGGMRDRAAASFTWRVGLREYLTVEGWAARYHTQDDTYLGRGHGVYWEAGHLFRTAYPDLRVRVTGAHQSYRADGTVDARAARLDPSAVLGPRYFIPESFDVLGAYLSFGLDDRDRYSRGFRFFADVGPTWNSQLGEGFLFSVGGGRSVLGPDRLAAYFTRSKGGGSVGGFTTEFGVRYEYMFDRW